MPYCPKCGNEVDDSMTFCPRCGASLKVEAQPRGTYAGSGATYQRRDEKSEKNEKDEKDEHNEKGEKQEKGERGYVGWLIGGLILIFIGIISLQSIRDLLTGVNPSVLLVLVGVIIIVGAVYLAITARRRYPRT